MFTGRVSFALQVNATFLSSTAPVCSERVTGGIYTLEHAFWAQKGLSCGIRAQGAALSTFLTPYSGLKAPVGSCDYMGEGWGGICTLGCSYLGS